MTNKYTQLIPDDTRVSCIRGTGTIQTFDEDDGTYLIRLDKPINVCGYWEDEVGALTSEQLTIIA